ncbi:sororin isoform X2 [Narcine bancroftii]|uniref:sororin isoform X2 n=1 Tax=Narcine bancroftii TaxID=1343680 RepID=UPI003831AFC4
MAAAARVTVGDVPSPARRRSNRLSATKTEENAVDKKDAGETQQVTLVKRSIVLRKIKPQKNGLSEATKENACGSAGPHSAKGQGLAVTTSDADPLLCTPLPGDQDPMYQKVRRSYSRLSPFGCQTGNSGSSSDTSTPNQWHPGRQSLFGFERLLASEALPAISPVKRGSPRDQPLAPTASSHVPLDAIPGVPAGVGKKKKKKWKVPQVETCVLDEWAAQMNASFEEAERFDLLVE